MHKFEIIADVILKFLEIISWPIIVLIGIFILKTPIINLLARIKGFGYGDTSVIIDQQEDQIRPSEHINSQNLKVFQEETEESAEKFLKSRIDLENINDQLKIERLYAFSILYFTLSRFEWLYNNIFGSQIRILDNLNITNDATKDYLKKHYDYVVSRHPEVFESYDYDSYLNFLTSNELIRPVGDNKLQITQIGQDFLLFLVQNRKDKQKPY